MAKGPILMLYEAGVPYDLIFQPEDINDEFANAAVARANADWLDSASIDCARLMRGSRSRLARAAARRGWSPKARRR